MPLDLSAAKEFNDGLMLDEIMVYTPVDGNEGTWDEATGTYLEKPGVIRYEGKCQFWSSRQGSYVVQEAEQGQTLSVYFFELPLESAELQPEDVIRVTFVGPTGNQQMLYKELIVKSKDHYSFSVSQIVKAEMREETPK